MLKKMLAVSALTLCLTNYAQIAGSVPGNTAEKVRIENIKTYLNNIGKVESVRKVKVNDSELLVAAYVLSPTPQSYIRCSVALPRAEVWTGRFIGLGNTGFPKQYPAAFYNWRGFYESTGCSENLAGRNNAVAVTDLGFSRHREKNPEVWKDFGFRATHLMTVTAKEVIRIYYGKAPRYSYFFGLSTGGGQGMHEAQQFPGDYDGIIAVVPASTRLYLLASNYHVYRALHDADGKRLFSKEHLQVIRQAAVEYFADKTPAYAAGEFLTDARYTPEAARAIAGLAAQKDKTITEDMQQRIEKLFSPVYIAGKYAGNAVPFGGSDLNAVSGKSHAMLEMFFGKGVDFTTPDIENKIIELARVMSPIFNAENPDLSAFRKRNGKLIVCSGMEDCIVPYAAFWDYYQRAAAAAGGVAKLKKNFLYYPIPGRSHTTYGKGLCRIKNIDRVMFDWVEKNIVPDVLTAETVKGREYPVHPYPMMTTGDAASGFKAQKFPEIKTPARDEVFTATMSAENAQKECTPPSRKINYPAGKVSTWYGYKRYDFTFENRKAFIVAPKNPAPGLPWLWCLQWPTAFVERTPTLKLLKKGWHYVNIDVHNTLMNPEGIKVAERFYQYLQSLSFAPQSALSGLSIGGLFSLRWAAEHPETVSCIYLDAPVTMTYLNARSLKAFEKAYNCKGIEALCKSPLSPNNNCAVIAKAKIPIIAIRHGEDMTVPTKDHLDVFVKNFRDAGGSITIIDHKFYGHHPHGLANPDRLAEFMLKHAK